MTQNHHGGDRADAAFRSALQVDDLTEVGVEPRVVRDRLRRRRGLVAAVATAVVVVLALATVPLLRQFSIDNTAGDLSVRIPPAGWRIEQFREVSIFVPETWGYASAPWVDWCAASPDGQPLPAQRKPYVSLDVPNDLAPAVENRNGCPNPPDSLTTEHVELKEAGPDPNSPAPQLEHEGDWWVAIRILGFDPAQGVGGITVKVVSHDQDLAERIADSAQVGGGPCPSTSPVQEGKRNKGPVDLSLFGNADKAVVCQYQPGAATTPSYLPEARGPGPAGYYGRVTGLAAATIKTKNDARDLVSALRTAANTGTAAGSCSDRLDSPDFAVAVNLYANGREATVFLTAGVCWVYDSDTGKTKPGGETGGIDLGSTIHPWSPAVCDAVVVPPIAARRWTGTWACSR